MRLKVSPKTAIQKIDALVQEGADMLSWLYKEYEDLEKKMEQEKEDEELAEERKLQAIRNEPDYIPMRVGGIDIGAIPNIAKTMQLIQPKPIPLFIGRQTKVGWVGIEEMEKQYHDWQSRTKEALKEIFMDFSPVYSFLNAQGDWSSHNMDRIFEKYINMRRSLEAKVDTLIGFYNTLASNIRNPLFYLRDKKQICFYDFVCPLTADTNEVLLCAFMFDFGLGEKIEMEDIFVGAFGGKRDEFCGKDAAKIKHAYDGINRKTNDSFGFPIFKKEGTTLSLTLPSRVTSNIT